MQYDKNGNILNLQRNGNYDDPVYNLQIDNLSYFYDTSLSNLNRLMKVTDLSNDPTGFKDDSNGSNDIADDYSYDANGNMVTDQNKGITSIKYNIYNLPTEIIFLNNSTKKINYIYNAVGVKIRKIVTNGTVVSTTDYLNGFQYYKATSTAAVVLKYFPPAEGYVSVTTSGTTNSYNYVFTYKDHLGNVRVSYGFGPTSTNTTPATYILQESNYYPFGLQHSNYNVDKLTYDDNIANGIGGTLVVPPLNYPMNKYKYNGKELLDELGLNMYDYGARNYDPALGRWMNIDPLAEKYRRWSPYNYCVDNPVRFTDPDGMGPDDVILGGVDKQKAFEELQKSVKGQLNLSKDDTTGKVSYTKVEGVTPNDDAQQLTTAIDDHSVTVNVNATNKNTTSKGSMFVGGAFEGNTVTPSTTPGGKATVSANQEINPTVLSDFSNANSKPGIGVLHEVTEAYQGALLSQASGVSSPASNESGSVYPLAHQMAVKQPGLIDLHGIDANGMYSSPIYLGEKPIFILTPVKIEYSSNGKTIMKYP